MMIVIRSFYCWCHIHCFLMSISRGHVSILPIANEFVNWIISASTNFVGSVISWTILLKKYVVSKFQILSCLKYECAKVAFFPRRYNISLLILPYEIRHVFNLYANSEFQTHILVGATSGLFSWQCIVAIFPLPITFSWCWCRDP